MAICGLPAFLDVDGKGEVADFHSLRKTLGTELGKAGVPIRVAMELMRHSDAKLTTKIYTDSGMLPIWDAVGALPMFNDTQIDTQNLVGSSQEESGGVPLKEQSVQLVRLGNEPLSPLETAIVPTSPRWKKMGPPGFEPGTKGL